RDRVEDPADELAVDLDGLLGQVEGAVDELGRVGELVGVGERGGGLGPALDGVDHELVDLLDGLDGLLVGLVGDLGNGHGASCRGMSWGSHANYTLHAIAMSRGLAVGPRDRRRAVPCLVCARGAATAPSTYPPSTGFARSRSPP